MTRFATAFALALLATGAAQAEELATRATTSMIELDPRDQAAGLKSVAATTGIAKSGAAATVFEAETRAALNLSANDEVTVTVFENSVSNAPISAR